MSDKQENSNIEITIYGARGSGKTTLAIGLYASDTNKDGKSEFSISSPNTTTKNKLGKLWTTILDGKWCNASSYEVDFKLDITRQGKTSSISFSDYKGEELTRNAQYVDKIVNKDTDGILFLLNPGMDIFTTDEKELYVNFLANLKTDIKKIHDKKPSIPIGIVTTAFDRLDTDLKTKRGKFDTFKKDLDNFLKNKNIPYESFNTTICGKLEDQNKPKIAMGNENTTSKPFLWIIDEIEKRKKEEQRKKRNKIFKIRFISIVLVVLLISGILFACSYVQNSKQEKKYPEFIDRSTECKDWQTYYNLSTNINSYIEDNNISNTNLLNSFICLMNTNIIKCAQNLDSSTQTNATWDLLEMYKGKTDSLYITTTNNWPNIVEKVEKKEIEDFLTVKEKELAEISIKTPSTVSDARNVIETLKKLEFEISNKSVFDEFNERKNGLIESINIEKEKTEARITDLKRDEISIEINSANKIEQFKNIKNEISSNFEDNKDIVDELLDKLLNRILSVVDKTEDISFLCDLKEELEKSKFLGDKTDSVLKNIDEILTKNSDEFIAKHINVNLFEFNKKFLYELEGFLKQHEKNPHKDKVIQALANKCDELINDYYTQYKKNYNHVVLNKTDGTIKYEFVVLCRKLDELVVQVNKCDYLVGKKCYNFAKEITGENGVTFDKKFAKKIEINKITVSYKHMEYAGYPESVFVDVKYALWNSEQLDSLNFQNIFEPNGYYDWNSRNYLVRIDGRKEEQSRSLENTYLTSVGSFSCLIFKVDGLLRREWGFDKDDVEKRIHCFEVDEINDGIIEFNDLIRDGMVGKTEVKLKIEVKITEDKSFTTIFNKYYGTNK